jgi:hypothetical protein
MLQEKTHRLVKNPQISARYLADYMAGSERARRTIVQNCKYQPTARVIQHNEAKTIISKFVRDGEGFVNTLTARAESIRKRLCDSDFERDLHDHNADYIDRFAQVYSEIGFPAAEIVSAGSPKPFALNGVKINVELHFGLRRLTKTNEIRVGAGVLRYSKGKALSSDVGEWQSALLFGYLKTVGVEQAAEPEGKLCVTLDAYSGSLHPAPGNALTRFQNMEAACASIAERWPNIQPPANAVL